MEIESVNLISSEDDTPIKKSRVVRKDRVKKDPVINMNPNKNETEKDATKKSLKETFDNNSNRLWSEESLLSQLENIDYHISKNIIKLFSEENTIPFIARYRKEMTGQMSPEKLRSVKKTYEEIAKLKVKSENMISTLKKQGKLNDYLKKCILSAKSLNELDYIYAPFKVSKHSLAERARNLGLEDIALKIFNGIGVVDPAHSVKPKEKGMETLADILLGIQHIIADVMSKNRDLLDEIQKLCKVDMFYIESTLVNQKKTKKDAKQSSNYSKNKPVKSEDPEKFHLYFNFKYRTGLVRPYQILAINRGESLKILNVKISIPDKVKNTLYKLCENKWLRKGCVYRTRTQLIQDAFNDAYKRLLTPLITREIRNNLNKKAEDASINVFSNNLKHLLMTQPVKGTKILGIDPGFANGCKMALISEQGKLLDTSIIYPHSGRKSIAELEISKMLNTYKCNLIALGNGTACRETEQFIGDIINKKLLPQGIKYCIINERGASIYSCSEEATKEFPDLDPNLRSAIYIARSLQDPLCEMVKIDPKHLGVGMYQHDISQKLLASSLHEVVVECVSFVGVDINTVSVTLLKQVAGLGNAKAEKIVKFREKNGPFCSRDGVKDVPGIGPKSYEQFIGFIRVVSDTSGEHANPLDRTWIHPESYFIAKDIAKQAKLSLEDLGKKQFQYDLMNFATLENIKEISTRLKVSLDQVKFVIESLSRDPNKDYRCDSKTNEPLFKSNVTSIDDLRTNDVLTGVITNVTDFGAFVDIGVGINGLLHVSVLRKFEDLIELGHRVEVRVLSTDITRKRISLDLIKTLF